MFHHKEIDKFRKQNHDTFYAIFRILAGLLFMQHGAQKLFGVWGGTAAELFTQMWWAGIIEFFGGILIAVGLFTAWVAGIAALEMLYAYLVVHLQNFPPIIKGGGELALLYFVIFLFIIAHGAGKWSLDHYFCKHCKKERK